MVALRSLFSGALGLSPLKRERKKTLKGPTIEEGSLLQGTVRGVVDDGAHNGTNTEQK